MGGWGVCLFVCVLFRLLLLGGGVFWEGRGPASDPSTSVVQGPDCGHLTDDAEAQALAR